jgi:hypothetical protein
MAVRKSEVCSVGRVVEQYEALIDAKIISNYRKDGDIIVVLLGTSPINVEVKQALRGIYLDAGWDVYFKTDIIGGRTMACVVLR